MMLFIAGYAFAIFSVGVAGWLVWQALRAFGRWMVGP